MTLTVLWVVYLILAVPVTGAALFGTLFDYTPRRDRTSGVVLSCVLSAVLFGGTWPLLAISELILGALRRLNRVDDDDDDDDDDREDGE